MAALRTQRPAALAGARWIASGAAGVTSAAARRPAVVGCRAGVAQPRRPHLVAWTARVLLQTPEHARLNLARPTAHGPSGAASAHARFPVAAAHNSGAEQSAGFSRTAVHRAPAPSTRLDPATSRLALLTASGIPGRTSEPAARRAEAACRFARVLCSQLLPSVAPVWGTHRIIWPATRTHAQWTAAGVRGATSALARSLAASMAHSQGLEW